ncbi:hypothetical protein M427DRAFT_27941 [Gonapodya prolifera JEL478]|uniref:DRBM domain-containing protein n=1 Tax=Gonapodya prolifera (strain JEL478) TaxID=1344416 RepID=A0A139AVU8_GONPJ|nr:hypothetical protein M427DRAFT_27941 [Gonapodya prolifera JEL478]|eukprot:KXS20861.1 hypothetical protein M427DRAFT_27941 [Gonapodya prolifera JEL478]
MSTQEPVFAVPAVPVRQEPPKTPPAPPLDYEKPEWSGLPQSLWLFEVVKDGVLLDNIELPTDNEFLVVGRLPTCNIELEHPKDLPKRTHVQLKAGDQLRFGASTRVLVLSGGPSERSHPADAADLDEVDDDDTKAALKAPANATVAKPTTVEDLHEVTWGFGEDAVDDENFEADTAVDEVEVDEGAMFRGSPFDMSLAGSSSFYVLRDCFELKRGHTLDFTYSDSGHGQSHVYIATLDLPISDPTTGAPIVAKGEGRRKRDAEVECSLDACKKLDRRGLLTSSGEAIAKQKRKKDLDDDDDEFFDRTGTARKPKNPRTATSGKNATDGDHTSNVETYESLLEKCSALDQKIADAKTSVDALQRTHDSMESGKEHQVGHLEEAQVEEDVDVDSYLKSLEKKTIYEKVVTAKREVTRLTKERDRLKKLLKLVKPNDVLGAPVEPKQPLNGINPPVWPPPKVANPSALAPPPVWPPPSHLIKKVTPKAAEDNFVEEEDEDMENDDNIDRMGPSSNEHIDAPMDTVVSSKHPPSQQHSRSEPSEETYRDNDLKVHRAVHGNRDEVDAQEDSEGEVDVTVLRGSKDRKALEQANSLYGY